MGLQTNFYDTQIYFAITFNGYSNYILEPKNWNKVLEHIPRDPKYYGFWSDFLEDKYGLTFTFLEDEGLTGGGQILKTIYETLGQGANSEVYFSVGILNSNTPQLINKWKINLNIYNCENPGGVSSSIEKMPFQGKLRARMGSSCTTNGYATVDGELLNPINTLQLRMHSKTLLERTTATTDSPEDSNEIPGNLITYLVVQPDLSNQVSSELNQVYQQPLVLIDTASTTPASSGTPADPHVSALDPTSLNPLTSAISQYTAEFSGILSINFSGSSELWWYKAVGTGSQWWNVTARVIIQRAGVVVNVICAGDANTTGTGTQILSCNTGGSPVPTSPIVGVYGVNPPTGILPGVTGSTRTSNVCNHISNWNWGVTLNNIEVEAQDNIYLQLLFCPPFTTGGGSYLAFAQLINYSNNIIFQQLTVATGSTAECYRVFDYVSQQIEFLTGQKNALISKFFSPGGAGYKYVVTNGYAIRNYGSDIYKPKKSLQSTFNDLQSMFCLGIGIKKINNIEYVVIEDLLSFFSTNVIARYYDTFAWKTGHNSSFCYNKIQLGYNKNEGLNYIMEDEFNTQGEYLLQFLKYGDNTLQIKCDIIASGYLAEIQRRNQYISNPGQSIQNDNDLFIFATSEPCRFLQIEISVLSTGSLTANFGFGLTSMALMQGDTFVTDSGANSGIIFTVISEIPGFPQIGIDAYYCSCSSLATDEITTTDFTIFPPSPNQVFAERNQPFLICQNVIDPSTIYNGRLSLKHILYNWRPLLGVGLEQVDPNSIDFSVSQIVTTLVKMNSLFTTKYISTEPNKGNVGDLTLVEINRENIKDYLKNGRSIFSPESSECKIKIGNNEMNILRMSLCGETGDDTKDFGGLVLKDDFGVNWFCHVMDIRYDIVKEIATLQVQKVNKVFG